MHEVTDGVHQFWGWLPHVINLYLVSTPEGDVVIDAGTRWTTGIVLRHLRGRKLAMVALTHVHPEFQQFAVNTREHPKADSCQTLNESAPGSHAIRPVGPSADGFSMSRTRGSHDGASQ